MTYFSVIDFNLRKTSDFCQETAYAHREIGVCPINGAPAFAHVSSVRSQIQVDIQHSSSRISIGFCAWFLHNWLTVRVCAPIKPSSTTIWAYEATSPRVRWPMPTSSVTTAFYMDFAISLIQTQPESFTPATALRSSWNKRSMHSIPRQLTCAWAFFRIWYF